MRRHYYRRLAPAGTNAKVAADLARGVMVAQRLLVPLVGVQIPAGQVPSLISDRFPGI